MSTTKRISDFASQLGSSAKALVKVALQSRHTLPPVPAPSPDTPVIILGNGPSLSRTIADYGEQLRRARTIAVNFFANTPAFRELRPAYYVMADPHFFNGIAHDNVRQLWQNLAATDWPMCLCVPVPCADAARELLKVAPQITISTFNFVGIEGFESLRHFLFARGTAMPRPRNVLIPALMTAINAGYRRIYITGADHSWLETIRVDDDNHVVSVQPHFYADSDKERSRNRTEYQGYHLHDILESFRIAFASYHELRRFAERSGISVINSTPGSYIDAFERGPLPL